MVNSITNKIETDHPNYTPIFFNMMDEYMKYYKKEASLRLFILILSIICIIISLFGVYAMLSLSCEKKRKEIAIRKVNGATLKEIFWLLSKDYLVLLIISSIISFSAGFIIMKKWCEKFIIQTSFNWWIYVLVFVLTGILILISVYGVIIKTSRLNPSDELRKE